MRYTRSFRLHKTTQEYADNVEVSLIITAIEVATTIRKRLAHRLVAGRFTHVMGVEGYAISLAQRWGVDAQRVLLAVLLHDYCKGEPKDALLAVLDRCVKYPPTAEDRQHPEVWHGLAAAQVAMEEYAVQDEDVLQAVAYHTTGIPELGPVGVVLYVADTLEPTRQYEGVESLRRQVDGLDMMSAARLAAETKLKQLQSRDRLVHSNTLRMAQWLHANGTASTQGA